MSIITDYDPRSKGCICGDGKRTGINLCCPFHGDGKDKSIFSELVEKQNTYPTWPEYKKNIIDPIIRKENKKLVKYEYVRKNLISWLEEFIDREDEECDFFEMKTSIRLLKMLNINNEHNNNKR